VRLIDGHLLRQRFSGTGFISHGMLQAKGMVENTDEQPYGRATVKPVGAG
jgi:hypothetical protein